MQEDPLRKLPMTAETDSQILQMLIETEFRSSETFIEEDTEDGKQVRSKTVPYPELFPKDLSTSCFDAADMEIAREAVDLAATIKFIALEKELKLQASYRFLLELATNRAVTAKSKDGFMALLTRSIYQHSIGKTEQTTTMFEGNKQKKKGFFR